MSKKIVVIGGGPGGYVAAIRLAQLGAEVTVIEKKYIGGTCLNEGCIPTKVLLHTAELFSVMEKEAVSLGLKVDGLACDWKALQGRKELVVSQLVNGVKTLFKSHGIKVLMGEAMFVSENEVAVKYADGRKEIVPFDKAIVATGSAPVIAPIPGVNSPGVITSNEALALEEIPKSLTIIGGGVIGCEFANVYSDFGTEITIIEMLPEIIPNMDQTIVKVLKGRFEKSGIKINTNSKVLAIRQVGDMTEVDAEGPNGPFTVKSDKVLLSIGRKPVTKGLGLEELGAKMNRGFVTVDKQMRTSVKNIYAIGDCNGGVLLAHTASSEGMVAAEHIMNKNAGVDFKTTPYCVYTKPELAGVGMTEKEAIEKGHTVAVGLFPLNGNGKSIIMGEVDGIAKYVTDSKTGEVLGLHMAGPRATELIVEGALAVRLEATIDEITTTIHAHPTVGESLHEAAHAVHGNAIHVPKKKKK